MIHKIYSVYDDAAKAFLQPFFAVTDGLAIRSFTEAVNDPNTSLSKYPSQFTLFQIGEYEDSDARISIPSTPRSMGLAVEFVRTPGPYGHSQVER